MSDEGNSYQQKMQQFLCIFELAVNAIKVRARTEQPGITEAELRDRVARWMRRPIDVSAKNADGSPVFRERELSDYNL